VNESQSKGREGRRSKANLEHFDHADVQRNWSHSLRRKLDTPAYDNSRRSRGVKGGGRAGKLTKKAWSTSLRAEEKEAGPGRSALQRKEGGTFSNQNLSLTTAAERQKPL